MPALIFDIETGPLDAAELKRMLPAFDPAGVKHGNTKDPVKKREQIESAREEHERKFFDRAALSPLTGRVIVIGYQQPGGQSIIEELEEREILLTFWDRYDWAVRSHVKLIGWNIHGFDLPFIVRRSWLHGVKVPATIQIRDRYWNPLFVDLMQRWALGAYSQWEKLDSVSKFFGHEGKNGEGADFHRLWKEDRTTAMAYLENDLDMTELVATSMGFC